MPEQPVDGNQPEEGQEGEVNGGMSNPSFLSSPATNTDMIYKDQGLFQVSVKLPHDPYKIQVMVGDKP